MRGITAGSVHCGVSLGGRETFVPEVDGEDGACGSGFCGRCLLGHQRVELLDEAVDAFSLAAPVSGEVERIADDDAGATMTAGQPQDGTLIAARLCAFQGHQRLSDAKGIGDRDADSACPDVEAEPGLGGIRHGVMIAAARAYNRAVLRLTREGI